MHNVDLINGYECSGNRPGGVEGLTSCGKFTGVPLSAVLKRIGVDPAAREVVFFGTDTGKEDVVFRGQTFTVDQQFARSITIENALKPEPILAWNLNGEPLIYQQGGPLRLIMPGWYGVANVKWISEIHLQEERFLGNYQARWYRSLVGVGGSGRETDTDTQWVENEITKLHLKSVIARVRKSGASLSVLGFVLNDGTPIKSVEVKVDEARGNPPNSTPPIRSTRGSSLLTTGRAQHPANTPWSTGHRYPWPGPAHAGWPENEEDFPSGQLAVSAQGDGLTLRAYGRCLAKGMPARACASTSAKNTA